MTAKKVTIIGTGYVGLVTGVCLAAKGHQVICVDENKNIVKAIKTGSPHIYEKSLPNLLRSVLKSARFWVTDDLSWGMQEADGVIIAVGTPTINGSLNLDQVLRAARAVGTELKTIDRVISVIVKSTVLPGSTDTVIRQAIESASKKTHGEFGLGMNPEFLREGDAISDFMEPDRLVLGCDDAHAKLFLEDLYAPWSVEKLVVNSRTAELIKYANNALLATQISAINEIANIAFAAGGIDVMDVVSGVKLDKRWNPTRNGVRTNPEILSYLLPGCGFGGSCFPKDVQALQTFSKELGLTASVLNAVMETNERQPSQVLKIIKSSLNDIHGKTALILGLAFKPGTDDVREAPSLKIVSEIAQAGARVLAHDPKAMVNFKNSTEGQTDSVELVEDWRSFVGSADIIIILTPWEMYKDVVSHDLSGKVVFDARRFLDPADVASAKYLAIGRDGIDFSNSFNTGAFSD